MGQFVTVVIVEHDALLRRGLTSSIGAVPEFDVRGSASTFIDACQLIETDPPDVAILGTTLPDARGLQLATRLRHRYPDVATIILAAPETDTADALFGAIRAGASAWCGHDIEEDALHELVRQAAAGEYVINDQVLDKPSIAARVLDQFRDGARSDARLLDAVMPLTARELDILHQVSRGRTNAEIGYALGISIQTVKNHLTSILRKLAVTDRTQAVVIALRHGWLLLDDGSTTAGCMPTQTSRRGTGAPD